MQGGADEHPGPGADYEQKRSRAIPQQGKPHAQARLGHDDPTSQGYPPNQGGNNPIGHHV